MDETAKKIILKTRLRKQGVDSSVVDLIDIVDGVLTGYNESIHGSLPTQAQIDSFISILKDDSKMVFVDENGEVSEASINVVAKRVSEKRLKSIILNNLTGKISELGDAGAIDALSGDDLKLFNDLRISIIYELENGTVARAKKLAGETTLTPALEAIRPIVLAFFP